MNQLRSLFVFFVIVVTSLRTSALRLLRGPKHPAWTWFTELWFEGMRAVFDFSHRFLSFDFQRRAFSAPRSRSLQQRVTHQGVQLGGRYAEVHVPLHVEEGAPTILYFHGGGYVLCSPRTHRELTSRMALFTGARCVVPSYRLAPEDPYPAAVDDCVAAYEALLSEGTDPERLLLAGDSAGGGLVLAVMQRLRSARLPMPCGAILLSPWVDPTAEGGTLEENLAYDYLMPSMLAMASSMYVGTGHMKDPQICLLEADLKGLPPLLVQSGDAEIFHTQHQDFVARAQEAHVEVEFETFPGMVHVFQMFGFLPQSRVALKSIKAFVQSRVGGRALVAPVAASGAA